MRLTRAQLLSIVESRVRRLKPDIVTALLASFRRLQSELSDADLVELAAGRVPVESLLGDVLLTRAFLPYRAALRKAVEHGTNMVTADLPVAKGTARPTVGAFFNFVDPVVIQGIRALENRALGTLTDGIKETLRAFVENGVRDGKNPRETARQLRQVIGMAPHQERYVANLERQLRTLDKAALNRELLGQRFHGMIERAIDTGKPLSEERIAKILADYRKRFTAHNTEVVTRQATIDAYRLSRRLTWDAAIENGYVDGDALVKRWVHSPTVQYPRPEHVALDGTVVPYKRPYPNGQMSAGEGDFGCHCTDSIEVAAPTRRAPSARSLAGTF